MKFTKTLAISLLALGAMQLTQTKNVKLDLAEAKPGEVAVNQLFEIGDKVELLFTEHAGSTGIIHKVIEPLPGYLAIEQEDTYDVSNKKMPGAPGTRHMFFIIKDQPKPEDKPLVISFGPDMYTMRFDVMASAEKDVRSKTHNIDFSKQTNATKEALYVKPGDKISIKLPDYNAGTGYEYNVTTTENIFSEPVIEQTPATKPGGKITGVIYTFEVIENDKTPRKGSIDIKLERLWENKIPLKHFTINVILPIFKPVIAS